MDSSVTTFVGLFTLLIKDELGKLGEQNLGVLCKIELWKVFYSFIFLIL
jgi:hypothetical protein